MNIPEKIRIGSVDYEVVLTDENLVEEFALGLHQVIRDNPGMFLKDEG